MGYALDFEQRARSLGSISAWHIVIPAVEIELYNMLQNVCYR